MVRSTVINALVGVAVAGCHAASAPPSTPAPFVPPAGSSSGAAGSEPPRENVLVTDEATVAATPARELPGTERDPVRLALGERAMFGAWDVRWIGLREGLVRLEVRHRRQPADKLTAAADSHLATHEVHSPDKLFTFEVRLVATHDPIDREGGRIEIAGREIDVARSAKFGQTLSPGVFSFPDGIRVHVESTTACEYDVSVPCPFGANYRAYAALGQQTVQVDIKAKVTKILGHTLEMGRGGAFVVRK